MNKTLAIYFITAAAFVTSLCAGPCATAQYRGRFDNTVVDAAQLYSEAKFSDALAILKEITTRNPYDDAAWYYRGLCEFSLRNLKGAKEAMSKAVELDGTNYWYRDRLAMLYAMEGETDLTIAQYEALLEEYPKKSDIYYNLVNLYLEAGEREKAIECIREIENLSGKNDATAMTIFNILRSQGKIEEAFDSLKEYVEEYSSPQVLAMLGDHEMGMFNDSTAIAYYNEALALDSSYAPARLGIAEAYRMTNKYPQYFDALNSIIADIDIPSEAKADYLNAVMDNTGPRFIQNNRHRMDSTVNLATQTHPTDTSLLQTAGIYYYRLGETDKAADYFRRNMNAAPDSKMAAGTFLQFLALSEDWEGLRTESYAAADRFPDETDFIEIASTAEYNLKNYKAIMANDEKIIMMAAGDSAKTLHALSSLGDIYHMTGDSESAYKTYEKALKINPDYAPVLNNYAYYLCEEGKNLKKAYRMSAKTVMQEPDNATYLDTFGWILHLLGRDLEAKAQFKHAMLYGGKESKTILNHYATILEKLGENDLAKVYRQMADKLQDEE